MALHNNTTVRVGTRKSKLSLTQTKNVLEKMKETLPAIDFELVPMSSPGDRDRTLDLQESAPDFFTRDIDDALRDGQVDMAIHSAKDLPTPFPDDLAMAWLPWYEDLRDVLVLPEKTDFGNLPEAPVAGVSSERREEYCRRKFPRAEIKSVRGNVESRIAKMDAGEYDFLVVAAAGLIRLGLKDRISAYIPLSELQTPPGQGRIAMTFRRQDERMTRLRQLFVKSVVLAGGGPADAGLCTVATREALERCDVCFYDALVSPELLNWLPSSAEAYPVGKRAGKHGASQQEICELLVEYACRGKRVVRLKGGDPGMFGRLAEEIEALKNSWLPYRVIPGVTSLTAATTGTGMLMTRRNVSRGFTAMTAVGADKEDVACGPEERCNLPMAFFMGRRKINLISRRLIDEGMASDTPCAVIYNAGREDQTILSSDLANISDKVENYGDESPALILVGAIADRKYLYRSFGALAGKRVLLTCSEALMPSVRQLVQDFGGIPVCRSMVRFEPSDNAAEVTSSLNDYDWLVVTSPTAVDMLLKIMKKHGVDARCLPKIIVTGPGTAARFKKYSIYPEGVPDSSYGSESLVSLTEDLAGRTDSVLRVRSDQAGDRLVRLFTERGIKADDAVLYKTVYNIHKDEPEYDMALFTSGSTVRGFAANWDINNLNEIPVAVMGKPTSEVLESYGLTPAAEPPDSKLESLIFTAAARNLQEKVIT